MLCLNKMRKNCSVGKVKKLKSEGLKYFKENENDIDFTLVDVRQPNEYITGYIPGARLIPIEELETRHVELEKEKRIVLYSRLGYRSMGAAIRLYSLGFEDVYSLDGGILGWKHRILKGNIKDIPKQITKVDKITDLLMISLKMEKGLNELYLKAIKKMESQNIIEIFHQLSKDEEHHLKKIILGLETIWR